MTSYCALKTEEIQLLVITNEFFFIFALKCKVGKLNFDVSVSVIIFFSGKIALTQHGHFESQDSLIPVLCLKEWPADLGPIGQDWTLQGLKAETLCGPNKLAPGLLLTATKRSRTLCSPTCPGEVALGYSEENFL